MIFPKQESSKKGHAHFCADSCDSPDFGKTFFPETRNPVFGTSDGRIHSVAPPKNSKTFFPETRNPVFGTSDRMIRAILHPWSRFCKSLVCIFHTIYALINNRPKKFRKLPSAARFCAKRFRHIDFWTFFLSIF